MPLTEVEKVSIRFHLGYPGQTTLRSMQAGMPTVVQSAWQIDSLLADTLKEETIALVRNILRQLEDILCHDIPDAILEHKAEQLEDLKINLKHTPMLIQQYEMWQQQLAKVLCVPVNPDFSGLGAPYATISNFTVH